MSGLSLVEVHLSDEVTGARLDSVFFLCRRPVAHLCHVNIHSCHPGWLYSHEYRHLGAHSSINIGIKVPIFM